MATQETKAPTVTQTKVKAFLELVQHPGKVQMVRLLGVCGSIGCLAIYPCQPAPASDASDQTEPAPVTPVTGVNVNLCYICGEQADYKFNRLRNDWNQYLADSLGEQVDALAICEECQARTIQFFG